MKVAGLFDLWLFCAVLLSFLVFPLGSSPPPKVLCALCALCTLCALCALCADLWHFGSWFCWLSLFVAVLIVHL